MATRSESAEIAVLPIRGKYGVGKIVTIDDNDLPIVSQFKWYANHNGYIQRTVYIGGGSKSPKYKTVFLHKFIAELHYGIVKEQVDHKNRNTLDNTSMNLIPCSSSQNQHNKGLFKNNSSGYKGVTWHKFNSKWCAFIAVNKKRIHIGYYMTIDEAAHARKEFEKLYMSRMIAS